MKTEGTPVEHPEREPGATGQVGRRPFGERAKMDSNFSRSYLHELKGLLDIFPHEQFEKVVQHLLDAYEKGRIIFVMGNGGSGATASHFACDINKGVSYSVNKKFRVICLNDNIATVLAYANDLSYDDVFSEQMKNFLQSGDVAIGISGSGNSANVLKAIRYASENGGRTIGLCGFKGGKLGEMVELPIIIESEDMQKIEDVHMIIVHMLMQTLTKAISAADSRRRTQTDSG